MVPGHNSPGALHNGTPVRPLPVMQPRWCEPQATLLFSAQQLRYRSIRLKGRRNTRAGLHEERDLALWLPQSSCFSRGCLSECDTHTEFASRAALCRRNIERKATKTWLQEYCSLNLPFANARAISRGQCIVVYERFCAERVVNHNGPYEITMATEQRYQQRREHASIVYTRKGNLGDSLRDRLAVQVCNQWLFKQREL